MVCGVDDSANPKTESLEVARSMDADVLAIFDLGCLYAAGRALDHPAPIRILPIQVHSTSTYTRKYWQDGSKYCEIQTSYTGGKVCITKTAVILWDRDLVGIVEWNNDRVQRRTRNGIIIYR